jgi:hypothetical protein
MTQFSPLDLLTVSDFEQDVIRCLVRKPHQTMVEIAQRTTIPLGKLNQLLGKMVRESRVAEERRNGENHFSVSLSKKPATLPRRSASTSLLDSLFD